MGNGVPFSMICCSNKNEQQIEDIDINKISKDFLKNTKTIKISNQVNKDTIKNSILNKSKENNQKNNIKKVQTHSVNSSNNSSKKIQKLNRVDSVSHKDPNISLFNNTFQILNNTQQYISFSNMNVIKNNLINIQIIKSLYNSKLNSSIINFSKINSNFDDIGYVNKKLILTGDLFFNKVIEIDKYGMKNSLRLKHDGVTIFGYKVGNNNSNLPQFDYYLDLKIAQKDNNYKKSNKNKNLGKVFEIFLDKKEKVFMLYYLHSSLLLYYKINDIFFFEIDKEYFFIVGNIFLSINVKRSINSNEKILNIEVDYEDEKSKKYVFEQKDVPIKIGRVDCTINIPKASISKLHSIIDFSDDNYIYKDANSTNGSTLLLKEDDVIKIKGEMNFKLEEISFKIKEVIIDEK